MKMLKEFKDFAMKGNVVDMAVGVIIGGAFGKIVSSLVNDIIMPAIGVLIGGVDFKDLTYTLKSAVIENSVEVAPAVTLNYGMFLQNVFDFLIIALCIFIVVVKLMGAIKKKEEAEEKKEAPKGPTQEELLIEIRDLLKKKA